MRLSLRLNKSTILKHVRIYSAVLLIFAATNAHAIINAFPPSWPEGSFVEETIVNSGVYTGSAVTGGQGGSQVPNRFTATNNVDATINNLDYGDVSTGANWFVSQAASGTSHTLRFPYTNIRGGDSAVIFQNSDASNAIVVTSDNTYGFLSNNTASFAVIRSTGNVTNFISLDTGAAITAFGGSAANPAITNSGSLFLTVGSTPYAQRNAVTGTITTVGGGITLNGINNINGAVTSSSGNFDVALNSTGTISGAITNSGAAGTLSVAGTATLGSTASGFPNLTVSGSLTTGGTISGVNTAASVTGTLNLGHTLSGSGIMTNSGILNINALNALGLTGLFTNSGTTNLNASLSRANATTNTGIIDIDSPFTFTNTGALDGSGGTMSGAGAFTNTSPGTYTVTGSNAFNFTGTFSNSGTVNVQGNASRANATTNTGIISIGTGVTFTSSGALTGTSGTINGGGGFTNSGTYTTNSTSGLNFDGLFTNSGTTTISATATRANATTNTGTIAITAGTFTNSGAMNGTGGTINNVGAFTNSGTYTVSSDSGLAFTGLFTNSGTTTVSGATSRANTTTNTGTISINSGVTFTNTGTMTFNPGSNATVGAMTGAGAFTNSGTFTFADTATYTATGGALNFTGLLTNSGTFNVNENLTRSSNTTNSAGTFTVASGKTFTNNGTFSLSGGTLTSTGSFTNNEIFAYTGGTINGAGLFTNNDTINITAGTFAKATGTFTNSGTGIINISGTGDLTVPAGFTNTGTTNINRSGNAFTSTYSGTTGSILNIGPTTASAFTTAGTISGIPTINIANGSSITTSAAESITGVNSSFNIGTSSGGGAFATFVGAASTLSGTGAINNYGTLTFDTGSSLTDGFSAVNMFSDSTLAFQGGASSTLVTTPITAGDSVTGTTLSITGATTLQTSTLINNIKNITVGTGATLQLNNGGQVTGNNTSGGRTINLAGTLTISSGGSFTISSADVINGTTATNGSGNGSISNSGTLLLDGSDLTLGGTFTNGTTGVFTINGVPTLTFTGAVTNQGTIFATFNESNNIPQIITSAAPSLVNGLIVIGYQNNYIAGGSYSFISGYSPTDIPDNQVGGYSLPQPSTYIAGWSLTSSPGEIDITVDRIGFGAVATDPEAKEIGYYLETLGENNPSQEILDLLNVLEHITDPAELNAALLALAIPEYVPLQALSMMQDVLNTVQGRIAHVRTGFSVGDVDSDRSVWVRPFVSSGRQQQKDNLQGYTARVNGFAFGVDNDITDRILLGAAGSIAKSKVTDQITVNSRTDISSYQAMIYGTVRSKSDAYLDWIIAGGVNNYHGTRGISTAVLTAEYSGQQFTAKVIGSKSYVWKKYYQLTPLASAQYSFLRQMPYAEVGSGFGRVITPSNVNLLEMGVGGQASVPFSQKKVTSIPEIHAMVLVDVKGGAIDTNSQFISGGPIISTTVQPGRLIGRIGASLTFAVSDRLQVIANYDFETRSKYISNEVYVNVKYTF